MLDVHEIIRIAIIVILVCSLAATIAGVYQIPKRMQSCPALQGAAPQTAADALLSSYFYPFTRDELSLVSLVSAFCVLAFMLAFLVLVNNFRVTSIIFSIPLLVISAMVLSTSVNLSNDPSAELREQYNPSTSIAMPLMYSGMAATILASALTLYYYGRHYIKDLRHII
jgi:hypothetical protein